MPGELRLFYEFWGRIVNGPGLRGWLYWKGTMEALDASGQPLDIPLTLPYS